MELKIFKHLTLVLLIISVALSEGCKKQDDFLGAKRNKADVRPETLADFQAILDNDNRLNYEYPIIGLVGSDNYYLLDADLNGSIEVMRNAYLWNREIWTGGISTDWSNTFRNIEYTNVVLDGLKEFDSDSSIPTSNNIKGQALFLRAFYYYNLAQLFCKPYIQATATTDLGLPIRLTSDVNIIAQRSSLSDTYRQIVLDLNKALSLLPEKALYVTRANKGAANGLLAKVYLLMGDYDQALSYADKQLKKDGALLDFNSSVISTTLAYRFPANGQNNPEIQYFAYGGGYLVVQPATSSKGFVNPDLYKSYGANDLRKTVYYLNSGNDNQVRFRGSYSGAAFNFCGIANNELYLIRAEANARKGNLVSAIEDLNALLINRYKTGSYIPAIASSQDVVLKLVIDERRKELPFVGNIRWEDLRRINSDPKFATTIIRNNNSTIYTLPPNDNKYVLPIPENETQISGIEQNIR